MRRLKLLGLSLMAVLALSTLASAVAHAAITPPLMLPGPGTTFTITGLGEPELATVGGRKFRCEKVKGSGEATSDSLGTFKVLFEKCKDAVLGTTCTGLGLSSGTIETKGEYHLRWLLPEPQKSGTDMVLLLEHVHYSCSIALYLVLGCLVSMDIEKDDGTRLEPNELVELFLILFLQTGGVQEPNSIDTASGEAMEACSLKLKKGAEMAEEGVAWLMHWDVEKFINGGKKVSILIMTT